MKTPKRKPFTPREALFRLLVEYGTIRGQKIIVELPENYDAESVYDALTHELRKR